MVGAGFFWKLYSESVFCIHVGEQVTICATIAFVYKIVSLLSEWMHLPVSVD